MSRMLRILSCLAFAALGACTEAGLPPGSQPLVEEDAEPVAVFTHFTDHTELFLEFPPLVVDRESAFLAHFTRLADFTPVTAGRMTVSLGLPDGGTVRVEVQAPSAPGIFRAAVTPRQAGSAQLTVVVATAEFEAVHDLGTITVHGPEEEAVQAVAAEEQEGIVLLKEQQWRTDFATVPVEHRRLKASVRAFGNLRADPGRAALVAAPASGWIVDAGDGFPRPGRRVTAGTPLLRLAPQLGGASDLAALEAAAARSRAADELARSELQRTEALVAQGVLPQRRLQQARADRATAAAERQAAEQRLAQARGSADGAAGQILLRAPLEGRIEEIHVAPGAFVDAGAPLLRVVDSSRLWLEVRIPEADAARLSAPSAGWFEGADGRVFALGPDHHADLVSLGAGIDPVSRTFPVVFELGRPSPDLRIGQYLSVHLFTGEEAEGLAVPVTAVIDDGGRDVVFVQRDGERFERRPVRLGVRDGGWVQIREGLVPGERVVSRGAYLVHLAASIPAEAGHGHAH